MTRQEGGKNRSWSFTLVLGESGNPASEIEDSLFEAGADDALLGVTNGVRFLDFDRVAPSFVDAVRSALADVETAGAGLHVVRIEPDDLVSAAEIARRSGRTREGIRLLVTGRRGPGGFPHPVSGLSGSSPLYSYAEVAEWLQGWDAGSIDPAAVEAARFVRRTNRDLESRSRRPGRRARAT